MILAPYASPVGFVRSPFGNTDNFNISSGVLQGDVLAPFLFVMCLDRLLHESMQNPNFGLTLFRSGTKSRGRQIMRLRDIDYADDVALFAGSRETLQDMMLSLMNEAAKAGMKLNIGTTKTAWMGVGKKLKLNESGDIYLPEHGLIPYVEAYKYLGHMKYAHTSSLTLQERVKLAWKAFHRLKPLWNHHINVLLRLRLFEALVGSVLSYGSASLVPTLTELRETDVEVNKMRRLATGTPLWNGHENTPTSALYRGDSKFSTQLRVSRAKLVGHLLRHDSPFQELILFLRSALMIWASTFWR